MTNCLKCLHRRVKVNRPTEPGELVRRAVDCTKRLELNPTDPCPQFEATMRSNMWPPKLETRG